MKIDLEVVKDDFVRRLTHLKISHPIVVAVPRTGIWLAAQVAREMGGDLDFCCGPDFCVRQFAEGEFGHAHRDVPLDQVSNKKPELHGNNQDSCLLWRNIGPTSFGKGRPVVIVDAGVSSGESMKRVIKTVRRWASDKIYVATGVASAQGLGLISASCDGVISYLVTDNDVAMKDFCMQADGISDAEVIASLRGFLPPTGDSRGFFYSDDF